MIKMRYIWLLIICICLTSCASSKNKTVDVSNRKAKERLDKNARLYNSKAKFKFFEDVSKDYYLGYEEFFKTVEDFFYDNQHINLEFQIEKVLVTGDTEAVDVKWFKTYVNNQGNPVKLIGDATLFFKTMGDKTTLINIKGNNPFTQ